MSHLPIRVYTPEPLLGHPVTLVRSIASDIWAGRELAWRLFIRDTSAQFRQTFLGYVWAFLPPMVNALTFVFLNSQGLFTAGKTTIPFAAFAMMGTLLWQVFVDSLNMPGQELMAAKPMLAKINFPREAIMVAGLYKILFNFTIRLVLLVGVMLWFQISFTGTILLFPVAMAGLMALGIALGMAIVPLSGLYGDFQRILPLVTTFWMLLTPVVYPPKSEGILGFLSTWNPVSPLITTARQCLTGEPFTHLTEFALLTGGSLALLFCGLVGFRIAIPHLIARMGG